MAVLASKVQYPPPFPTGPGQSSVVSQYVASYRKPVGSADSGVHNGAFMSPTESEFSENNDGQESVR